MTGTFVLIGVASARSTWFSDLTRWSTSGVVGASYTKAMTIDEVRAILGSGRRVSAVLVGSATPGLDREFIALTNSLGAAVIVVAERSAQRDWDSLGVAAVMRDDFGPDDLTEVLNRHAKRIDPTHRQSGSASLAHRAGDALSPLVAVTGIHGSGISTLAMGLAQGLAAVSTPDVSPQGTALADLTRGSDLAMYHDVGDVMPGLPELVALHRGDTPDPDQVRDLLFDVTSRSYSVLLGQRRSRDSAAMGPLSTSAAIDGLRRSYQMVVADVDPTFDGETETGSLDIELFNAAQRHAISVASVVLVVTVPGLRGVRRLAAMLATMDRHSVAPERVVPVFNRAPRGAPARASLTRLTSEVSPSGDPVQPPLFIRHHRLVEDLHHSAGPLPQSLTKPLASAVTRLLGELGRTPEVPARRVAATGTAARAMEVA